MNFMKKTFALESFDVGINLLLNCKTDNKTFTVLPHVSPWSHPH
jgi:hypothetical protein